MSDTRIFRDRADAGRALAARLETLRDEHPIVLGLPRGGVPVAAEVAAALDAPLDVIIVRKLGVPSQPELGMGAIGEEGVRVLNERIVAQAGVSPRQLADVEAREHAEALRRAQAFRRGHPMIELRDRTVVIVDDGLATGGTARAAIAVARAHGAGRVVLAVPVAPPDTADALAKDADEVVALEMPGHFFAIGQWYRDFTQTRDDEVIALLDEARARHVRGGADGGATERELEIPIDVAGHLAGTLRVPDAAVGLVVFAHGSGSSRHSPRNVWAAERLHDAGIATLLFDLLTEREAFDRANVFDIGLLAERLIAATRRVVGEPEVSSIPVGYFGASTGAGAALWAAAVEGGPPVAAVVSRGGRPDLAGPMLPLVTAPTLLIVGGYDDVVLELNREAASHLRCEHRLEVVPGATHLFEEPGTLAQAARLARDWFVTRFRPSRT
ncbi:MAG: phosphoribosyltransferase family protein [Acidimicrobiia bacterium]